MTKSDLYARIYVVVKKIPSGRVATYGQIAHLAGMPGQARLVGYALHQLSDKSGVPWHRVINRLGQISLKGSSFENGRLQEKILRSEGVRLNNQGCIDLKKFRWIE
jgi:methylated-DNA-protein-cysteine methyltransferase-like protein